MDHGRAALGPGDRHIGKPTLLLQRGEAAFVERPLRREDPLLPSRQIDGVELQPLGRVDGHDGDLVAVAVLVIVHHQTDMLEEAGEVVIFLHRAGELGEVFEAAGGFGGAVGLEHGRVAGFFEDDSGKVGVGDGPSTIPVFAGTVPLPTSFAGREERTGSHAPPSSDVGDETGERVAGAGLELVRIQEAGGGDEQRLLLGAGGGVDRRQRLVAEPALGLVDDPLERQVVCRLVDKPEVGERVADLRPLVEAEAADDLIRQADRDESLLELAGLELGADEDCNLGERLSARLHPLDFLADPAGLLWPVPDADDADLLALARVGPQSLAEPASVVGDDSVGGGEDVAGRAVILLQPDDLGAGEVLLELEDIGDLGSAPGIDRLVVIADAAQVAARFGEELQPFVLGAVCVLVFVDKDVFEPVAIGVEHVGVCSQDHQHVQQQVAEIAGVERLQPRLIGGVELTAAAGTEALRFPRVDLAGSPAAVLPAVDEAGKLPCGPALLVEVRRADQLLHHAQLVVGVEDGEVALEPDQLGVGSEHSRGDRVEGAQPGHPLDRSARDRGDSLLHLARRLVGESDGENLARPRLPAGDQMGKPCGQRGGLSRACAGEHKHRPFRRQHGFALGRVQTLQVGGLGGCLRRFRHLPEVGSGERNGNRMGGSKKVPTVVPDIHVIHRLVPTFFVRCDSESGVSVHG